MNSEFQMNFNQFLFRSVFETRKFSLKEMRKIHPFFLLPAEHQGLPKAKWWEADLPEGEDRSFRGSLRWRLDTQALEFQKTCVPISPLPLTNSET